MTRLLLYFLGPFRAVFEGAAVSGFPTDKTRALLAFLAMEADRPHRRERLAALLWPEWPESEARDNLRRSLHRLRKTLRRHDPSLSERLLLVERQTIQLHSTSFTLDVDDIFDLLQQSYNHNHPSLHHCAECLARLLRAVRLYQGELLAGFTLRDAAPWEEWLVLKREHVQHEVMQALLQLGEAFEVRADWKSAEQVALLQLQLEPWREGGHRLAMRALSAQGEQGAALDQFERCARILHAEFATRPSDETTELANRIRGR